MKPDVHDAIGASGLLLAAVCLYVLFGVAGPAGLGVLLGAVMALHGFRGGN